MKRILKKPEIRQAEIIAVAEKLFKKHGYDKTPVESIIKEAGIAKGTFYYYFKSKKDILRAIIEQTGLKMEEYYHSILEDKNLTVLEKFHLMLRSQEKKTLTESPAMKAIHKPENRELQEQLNIQSIKIIAPLINEVLTEGYKKGIFKKLIGIENVQIILAGSQFLLSSGLFDWPAKKRNVFLKSIQTLLEQLVEVKPGTFNFISNEK